MDEGYRGPQVCKIVGISYRQLDYWARTGLLEPSVRSAAGSGSHRVYSYGDLVELKVIKRLLDAGIRLHGARRAITYLRDHLAEGVGAASLVLDGSTALLAHTDQEMVDILRGGQGVLNILPLANVVEELDAAIHSLRPEEAAQAVTEPRPTAVAHAHVPPLAPDHGARAV